MKRKIYGFYSNDHLRIRSRMGQNILDIYRMLTRKRENYRLIAAKVNRTIANSNVEYISNTTNFEKINDSIFRDIINYIGIK